MKNLVCYDLQGRPIDYFTQWDLNLVVDIYGVDTSAAPRVCFRNKLSAESVVVRPEIIENGIRTEIPNSLLTMPYPVIIEIFYEYADGSLRTRHIFSVPVVPSLRSTAYKLIDNIDYVNWAELQEHVHTLLEDVDGVREDEVMIVSNDEPGISDILWFNTGVFSSETE